MNEDTKKYTFIMTGYLIQIRMYLNCINRYYSTGIYLKPSDWNDKGNVPKKLIVLRQIESIKQELIVFEQDTRRKLGHFTLKDFDLFGEIIPEPAPAKEKLSFTAFVLAQHRAEKVLRQESWTTRKLTIDYFNEYRKDVSFEDINYKLIEGFEFFLRARKYHTNTIANHHKHIKRYIIRAINEDLLEMKRNPYQKFPVKKEMGKCQVLNDDELERFENLTFDNPNTFDEKVKDMFLFGVYTGLRFSDIYRLRKPNYL